MRRALIVLAALAFCAVRISAEVAPEHTGEVASLPMPPQPHWVWTADLVLQRSALLDADGGGFLGMINGGYGTVMPLVARSRPEIYVPATYYSRGTHGTRTDVVEIYDVEHLAVQGEVVIPPKRATNAVALAHAALSDDDRFVVIFNWTTGTSLSIVDVQNRRFAGEIETPGCSLVYPVGPRRFLSLCADGAVFTLTLNDDGSEAGRTLSKPFIDPKVDPVTEKAVRIGDDWLFVSFDSIIHPVNGSGATPTFGEAWSLIDDTDKREEWRIGGNQHLAVHRASGRLYALMHRGGADTHKDPGEEVWVFEIATHKRVARVKLKNPGFTVYGFPIGEGTGTLGSLVDWLADRLAPPMVGYIAVTQDAHPLLVTSSQFTGMLGIYDAETGAFLRRVGPTGWTSDVLQAPWGGS